MKMIINKTARLTFNKQFEYLLLEAVDEALNSMGEDVKKSIYYHLKEKFSIETQEIPQRMGEFLHAIDQIFGLGANYLEIMFIKNLQSKIKDGHNSLDFDCAVHSTSIEEYIRMAIQVFESANNEETGEFDE